MLQNRQTVLFLLVTCAIVTAAFPARAQRPDPEAVRRELLDATLAHVRHKRPELALKTAKGALEIRRDRETLCNAGLIAARIESFVEAAEFLSECIEATKEPSTDEKELEKRITHASTLAMARAQIGTLRIVATPLASVTVDHRRIGLAPIDHDVFVTPNKPIDIYGEIFDREGSERVTVAPGQTRTVLLHLKPRTESLVFKPILAKAPAPARSSIFPSNTPFWISFISTAAATGATAHFLVASELDFAAYDERLAGVRNRYNCGCECNVQPDCKGVEEVFDRGALFRHLAIASGITAGIGLAVTIAIGKYLPIKSTAKGVQVSF